MCKFIWSIISLTLGSMYIAYMNSMFLLPAVLALWNTGVYICFFNSYNVMTYIEAPANEILCFHTIL